MVRSGRASTLSPGSSPFVHIQPRAVGNGADGLPCSASIVARRRTLDDTTPITSRSRLTAREAKS